jgi:hypothetical protein
MAENKNPIKPAVPTVLTPDSFRDQLIIIAFTELLRNDIEQQKWQHAQVADYTVRYADAVMLSRAKDSSKRAVVMAVGKPTGTEPNDALPAPPEIVPVPPPPASDVVMPPNVPARPPSIKDHLPKNAEPVAEF